MSWLLDIAIDWFWIGFVERMSEGRPWWAWALWALSPLWLLAAVFGLGWLLLRAFA
jgi:hypothetical protein